MGTEGIQDKYINTNISELDEFYRLKNFRDWYSVVSTAEKKGMEKGREEGIKEANLSNARNMKQLGVAVDIISQVTGLSEEEISNL